MINASFPRTFSLSAMAGLLLCVDASAASQCRGLDQPVCATDDSCVWVSGYTRKDGRTVSSHCKLRRGQNADTQADATTLKTSALD